MIEKFLLTKLLQAPTPNNLTFFTLQIKGTTLEVKKKLYLIFINPQGSANVTAAEPADETWCKLNVMCDLRSDR